MLEGIRSRLTYANVMASIAVFIALGAGAYAAGLAPDSVKSKHIVDGKVKSIDVDDHGLTGTDIRADTVAGTSRALVYDSVSNTVNVPPTPLATVRIGSKKWKFTGQCAQFKGNFFALLDAEGPAFSVRRSEVNSVDDGSAGVNLSSNPAVVAQAGGSPGAQAHVYRSAGTAFLSSGQKLMRVDYNLVADGDAVPPFEDDSCSIWGTVTPAA